MSEFLLRQRLTNKLTPMQQAIWLQLRKPQGASESFAERTLHYAAKLPLFSATARVESKFSPGSPDQIPAFESKIEFHGKVPFRAPYRYRISARAEADCGAAAVGEVSPKFEFEVRDLTQELTERWCEGAPGLFERARTCRDLQCLDLRGFDLPPILPAPLVLQALESVWNAETKVYLGLVLAGSKLSLLRLKEEARTGDERVYEIHVRSLMSEELKHLSDWRAFEASPNLINKLSFEKAHQLTGYFSDYERVFTRLEVRLPVLGSIAFLLKRDA